MKTHYRVIPLTKGYVAIIDATDFLRVNRYSWHVHFSKGTKKKPGNPYARATIDGKKVYLHRFITGAYSPMHVDHKNHQTLDCRNENLSVCTYHENMENRRHLLKNRKNKVDTLMCSSIVEIKPIISDESKPNEERIQNVAA